MKPFIFSLPCLSLSNPLCQSICLFVSVCLSLSVYLCLYVFLSLCLSVCLSVCMYVCLSVCLSCLSLSPPPLSLSPLLEKYFRSFISMYLVYPSIYNYFYSHHPYLFKTLSIYPSICPSTYQSISFLSITPSNSHSISTSTIMHTM